MFAQALGLLGAVDAAAAERISGEVKGLEADGIGISPQPLVTGEDLIAMGLRPGPAFKRILDGVTDAQLEGRVRTKAEAMELAGRMGV
jgi:hypothetical protein